MGVDHADGFGLVEACLLEGLDAFAVGRVFDAVGPQEVVGLFDGLLFGECADDVGFLGDVFDEFGLSVVRGGASCGDVGADADVGEAVAAWMVVDFGEGVGA